MDEFGPLPRIEPLLGATYCLIDATPALYGEVPYKAPEPFESTSARVVTFYRGYSLTELLRRVADYIEAQDKSEYGVDVEPNLMTVAYDHERGDWYASLVYEG